MEKTARASRFFRRRRPGLFEVSDRQARAMKDGLCQLCRAVHRDHAPRVKLTMGMLDWRKKEVALFKYRDENDLEREVVDYAIVAIALGIDPEMKYDKVYSAVREIFERFLEFLARFEGFLATGVVKQTDLNPYLGYWIKLIAGRDTHSPEVTKQVLPSLWKFIDYYGYRDVRKFVSRYEPVAFPEFKR